MWHEARKQEKFLKNVMVDVKKRAERRKVFYEKIKMDPIRFLRLYGTKLKVIMEPEVAMAAENPSTMMVWSGDGETVIDRFDVRTTLDCLSFPEENRIADQDVRIHERMCNYERFRCLVHNQFAKVSESVALSQIDLLEKYGEDVNKLENKESKKKASEKAAIGYVYVDTDYLHTGSNSDNDSDNSQDSEPDLDMDLDIELDISRLSIPQQKDLLKLSHQYGMHGNDYLKLLKLDKSHEEDLRTAKLLEEQKAQFHGRKSRRERKIFKEQRLRERYMKQDPRTLSFGASSFREELYQGKHILTPSPKRDSQSRSKSPEERRKRNLLNDNSRNLNSFVNVPTLHFARSRSRSRDSPPLQYGPRLPWNNSNSCSGSNSKDYRKKTSSSSIYRDKMERNYDRRRLHNDDRYSRSPERNIKKKNYDEPKNYHNYRLSKSKSPQMIPEEEVVKKKYYHSDPEEDHSSNSSSSDSFEVDNNEKNHKANRKDSNITNSSQQWQQNNFINNKIGNKFNPKDLMKKQMEIQLNRAYRADKKAELEKQLKVEKERSERENQLKEMAAQIRKRELERRRKEREMSKSRSILSSSSSSRSSIQRRSRRSRSREQSCDRYHQLQQQKKKLSPRRSRSKDRVGKRYYR